MKDKDRPSPADLAKDLREQTPSATTTESARALLGDDSQTLANGPEVERRADALVLPEIPGAELPAGFPSAEVVEIDRTSSARDENAPRRVHAEGFTGQYLDAFFDDNGNSADPGSAKRQPNGSFTYDPAPVTRETVEALHAQFPGLKLSVVKD